MNFPEEKGKEGGIVEIRLEVPGKGVMEEKGEKEEEEAMGIRVGGGE